MSIKLGDVIEVAVQELANKNKLVDVLAKNVVMFNKIGRDRIQKADESGNNTFKFGIAAFDNPNITWIGDSLDVLPANVSQTFVSGELPYKKLAETVTWTLDEIAATGNTANALIQLARGKAAMGRNTFVRRCGQAIFNSSATNPLQLTGLGDIMDPTQNYAGIDNTLVPNWKPYIPKDQNGNNITALTMENLMSVLTYLSTISRQDYSSSDLVTSFTPDLIVSGAAVMSQFASIQQIQQVYMQTDSTLKTGFSKIMINGIEWFADPDCPGSGTIGSSDNHVYILSTGSFNFRVRYGFDSGRPSGFDVVEGYMPQQQQIRYNTMFHSANVYCTNLRANALFPAITL